MEEFTKELRPAEVKRHCVCVPKERQHLFPPEGGKITAEDERTGSTHEVTVGSQCRSVMHSWFAKHPEIRAGDIITFRGNNGTVSLKLSERKISRAVEMFERKKGGLSIFEGKVLDLIIQALADIEKGGIDAIVRVSKTGISIEWGRHIKSTRIILGTSEVGL